MKLLSHLMKLLHLMTLPSQQFCLCGTIFNMHDTLIKHALRLALEANNGQRVRPANDDMLGIFFKEILATKVRYVPHEFRK